MEVLITNTDCHNKVEMQCSNCTAPLQCTVQRKDFVFDFGQPQPEPSIEISDEHLTIKITGLQPNIEYRATVTANDHQGKSQTTSVEFPYRSVLNIERHGPTSPIKSI
jgi:hypothetical protein